MENFLPLLTLLIGWELNQLHQRLKDQEATRAELCRAIASLLDIWYAAKTIDRIICELAERYNLPLTSLAASARPELYRRYISPESCATYSKAVATIAGFDPLLAFDLSHRHRIPELIAAIDATGTTTPQYSKAAQSLSDVISTQAIKGFERCILRLAWRASKKTWWSCRKRFSSKMTERLLDNPDLNSFLVECDALIKGVQDAASRVNNRKNGDSGKTGDTASA